SDANAAAGRNHRGRRLTGQERPEGDAMRYIRPSRVLIVAHQTADSPELARAVADRTEAGPCMFTLLVPSAPRGLHCVVDPEDDGTSEAEARLAAAVPALSEAAGDEVI